ncbi:ABC transporter permease [Actinomadura madurae]|uniref:ABC transporter permease n=1 Tax=Actinomadura madurae TaxID=1993 RepID=UPI002026004A|nr:ABC transporter permease [Actinomadura madurae]MCP9967690.1 ABC transporter permease [Actinomadura madurae]URM96442.1 ABC transporter permease [Actinomadura madurae]
MATTGTETVPDDAVTLRGNVAGRMRLGDPMAYAAFAVLGLIIAAAVLVPPLFGTGDVAQDSEGLLPPSGEHPFGTDRYGRDVFLRCIAAARIDIALGLAVAVVVLAVGSVIGAVSATFGRVVDGVVMRVTDVLLAFPGVVLALIITASLDKNAWFAATAVVVAFLPLLVRLARAKALEVRSADYIAAARLTGTSTARIAITHVLPNSFKYPFVQSTLVASWAILDFAALSFLGVGVRPPTAEWGAMIAEGVGDNLGGSWWPSFFPGLMILLSAASFQIIGDWLDRRLR